MDRCEAVVRLARRSVVDRSSDRDIQSVSQPARPTLYIIGPCPPGRAKMPTGGRSRPVPFPASNDARR